jgi:ABC-type transport system substrate-binding protein
MWVRGMRKGLATSATVGAAVSACVLAIALPAGAATEPSQPHKGGSVTMLIGTDARSMDPAAATTQPTAEGNQLGAVYDRLFMVIDGKLTPRLALSATPSKDLLTWTVKLRPGVKFSDGTAFDATAVKANWDRHQSTPTSLCRSALTGFQSWAVVDPLTLKVTLNSPIGDPFPGLLQGCLGVIASPAALQAYGSRYGTSPDTTVGAGPFLLKEWVRNDHETFARNANYWDTGKPRLDSMTLKVVTDPQQRVSSILTNQSDMTFFGVVDAGIAQVKAAGNNCPAVTQYGGTGFAMNMTHAPFDDVRMRQAFAYATDQEDLSQKATGGVAQPLTTFFPKGSPFYDQNVTQKTDNLTKAQKLVDAYIAEKGTPPPINFVMADGFRAFGLVLAQQWSRLKGVTVNVNQVLSSAASQALAQGTFDVAASGTQGVDPDDGGANSLYNKLRTGSSANAARFSDPAVDSLLDHARSTTDDSVRKDDYSKVVQVMFDKVPYVMAYRVYQPVCSSKSVTGLRLFDSGDVDFAGASRKGT